jgi:hypothetical protein
LSDEVYKRLREFLHNLPGGYPESEAAELLESMAGKGLIFRIRIGEDV